MESIMHVSSAIEEKDAFIRINTDYFGYSIAFFDSAGVKLAHRNMESFEQVSRIKLHFNNDVECEHVILDTHNLRFLMRE